MDKERLKKAVKSIAIMADSVDDIPVLLAELASLPIEQWEKAIYYGKLHRPNLISGLCPVCNTIYEAYTRRAEYDDLCPSCSDEWRSELRTITQHRYRAKKEGLISTLKLSEWIKTARYFKGCAYCLIGHIEEMDHFLPLDQGGGTEVCNIVPACEACNRKKMYVHPDKVTKIPRADIERVREYLNSLKTGTQTP